MSSTQKVIKYCAMGFAIALMIMILSGITAVVSGIDKGINWDTDTEYMDYVKDFEHVENLDLTNYSGKMFIQVGSVDRVVVKANAVPDSTVVKMDDNNTLCIYDNTCHVWFFDLHFWDDRRDDSQITVILPIDFIAKNATLDNNSGDMEIRGLCTNELELRGGSGSIVASNLEADKFDITAGSGSMELEKAKLSNGDIDSGSGSVEITDSMLNSVDINTGSGEMIFEGSMTGDNKLDGGSGSVTFNVSNPADSYEFDMEEGSGGIWLNGDRVKDRHIKTNNAQHSLEVEGGSGEINLEFGK